MDREAAVDRLAAVVDAVESGPLPVPVREVWTYGDVALGLDPIRRLDVYVAKSLPERRDEDADEAFRASHGVAGVGTAVHADWARAFPDAIRANRNGHVAPERCLGAHLLGDEPSHLEVCNSNFEENVTQRLRGALLRDAYEEVLDPRAVCLYADGARSETAFERLRRGDFAFPTLPEALEMLGADAADAAAAAEDLRDHRADASGVSVRGDVL